MHSLNVFTVRELRLRSGELIREAEVGNISLITKHGRPTVLAIPFDERLLNQGVHRAMALHLFEKKQLTIAQAAKVAGLSLEEFLELLNDANIPAVDYPTADLEDDLAIASQ